MADKDSKTCVECKVMTKTGGNSCWSLSLDLQGNIVEFEASSSGDEFWLKVSGGIILIDRG